MLDRRMMVVATVCVSVAGCRAVRQDPPVARTDAEAGIRLAQARMREAAARLDVAALYAHVLDAPVPIVEDGRIADTKAVALARTEAGFRRLTKLGYTYSRDRITMLTPTLALWVGEGSATATLPDGREVRAPFAESLLFELRDGRWMVLHAHRSSP